MSSEAKAAMNRLSTKIDATSFVAIFGVVTIVAIARFVTPYMLIATINYFTLLLGFTFVKKDIKKHAILMSTGIVSDLTLVLILEFQRDAIAEAASFKLSTLNQLHILCSSIATLLYIPIVVLGICLLRRTVSSYKFKKLHGRVGIVALVLRTLGFFLMFSMLGLHHS